MSAYSKKEYTAIKKMIESSATSKTGRLFIEFNPDTQEYIFCNTHWIIYFDIYQVQKLNIRKIDIPTPMTVYKNVRYCHNQPEYDATMPDFASVWSLDGTKTVNITPFMMKTDIESTIACRIMEYPGLTDSDDKTDYAYVQNDYIEPFYALSFKGIDTCSPVIGLDCNDKVVCIVMPMRDICQIETIKWSFSDKIR